jgi:hypothetical protein
MYMREEALREKYIGRVREISGQIGTGKKQMTPEALERLNISTF